jgi:UDP-N-acetylglucosamine 2-epimerase
MKIVSIVGARPQFIKASVLSQAIRKNHTEILVHTGQHYDDNMSEVFFEELGIPAPQYHLGVGSGLHGAQTGAMLTGIERILVNEQPDWVLVYGDTNTTLAGALAAAKLHIKIAHVEAGLRSFNRSMPEEVNRILTDHLSDLLFCPSKVAADNLAKEGIISGVHIVGDVMYAALIKAVQQSKSRKHLLTRLNVMEKQYILATVHRAENTDDLDRLGNIITAFCSLDEIIVFPMHPRTRQALEKVFNSSDGRKNDLSNLRIIDPVGYLDMACLENSARMILTDSGGIQKEAYWLRIPCVTLRDETEWIKTVETGWNCLAGANTSKIIQAVRSFTVPINHPDIYAIDSVGEACVNTMQNVKAAPK